MKMNTTLNIGVCVLALEAAAAFAAGASAHPMYYLHHWGAKSLDPNTPMVHVGPYEAPYVAPKKNKSGKWTDVGNVPFTGEGGNGELLLTDGSVIMNHALTGSAGEWYKLTPDSKGNYIDGTWTQIASMPSGYQPYGFASQVLTNGNVLIEGGEYNENQGDWTNKGAIYDPVADKWTSVSPPSGWSSIGDSESIILPDGSYFLGDCCFFGTGEDVTATVSGTTVNWNSPVTTWKCANSGYPCMDEEGFTALPSGEVLLVDVWDYTSTTDEYWIYDAATATWTQPGSTKDRMSDTNYFELGGAPLTPLGGKKGTVIQLTANTSTPGPSDVYNVATGTWTTGPTLKVHSAVYMMADAPAATLPDGNVLVAASPGYSVTPTHFWEFRTSSKGVVKATRVNDTKTAPQSSDFTGNMLLIPTGQVLWDNSQSSTEVAVYTPKGKPKAAWLPVVTSVNSTLTVGSTGNAISGTNFNGFDLGGMFGDDAQQATNYPIVRITNNKTGDVCFGRSYNFSTMGVYTSGTTNATFDLPSSCETGASSLQVIVNGIASQGVSVTLNS